MKKVPVLFTIFNRSDVAIKAFQSIKQYQPERLYIAADGPRPQKCGEDILCENTRRSVLNEINWPCEVRTLFQKENKGCAYAMYEGITWFFENEEWGVVCEDDVVLSLDFFKICEILLPMYANEDKLMAISAENNTPTEQVSNGFVLSNAFYCWGWASWRKSWDKMDMDLTFWPKCSLLKLIQIYGLFRGVYYYVKVTKAYGNLKSFNSWATRYFLSIFYNNGFVMIPTTNLSLNIGQDIDGTHYDKSEENLYKHLAIGKMSYPLCIPTKLYVSREQKEREKKDFFRLRMYGLKKGLFRLKKL